MASQGVHPFTGESLATINRADGRPASAVSPATKTSTSALLVHIKTSTQLGWVEFLILFF